MAEVWRSLGTYEKDTNMKLGVEVQVGWVSLGQVALLSGY